MPCVYQPASSQRKKNGHVRRMADIYRLARGVVIWLGPSSASSSLTMATMSHLGAQTEVLLNRLGFAKLGTGKDSFFFILIYLA